MPGHGAFSGVMVRGSGPAWDPAQGRSPTENYSEVRPSISRLASMAIVYDRLPGAHGGDAPIGAHHEAMHRQAAGARRTKVRLSREIHKIVPARAVLK